MAHSISMIMMNTGIVRGITHRMIVQHTSAKIFSASFNPVIPPVIPES